MKSFSLPTSLSADALQPILNAAAAANSIPIDWGGTNDSGTVNTPYESTVGTVQLTGSIQIQPGQVVVGIQVNDGGVLDGAAVKILQPALAQAIQDAQAQAAAAPPPPAPAPPDQSASAPPAAPPAPPAPPAKKKTKKTAAPPQTTEQTTMADDTSGADSDYGTVIDSSTGTQTDLYTGQTYTPPAIPQFSTGGDDGTSQLQQGITDNTANVGLGPDAATGGYPIGYVDPGSGQVWNGAYWASPSDTSSTAAAGTDASTGGYPIGYVDPGTGLTWDGASWNSSVTSGTGTTYPNFEGPGATAQGTAPTTFPAFEGPGATPDQGTAELQQGLSGGQAGGIPPFETNRTSTDTGTDQLAQGLSPKTTPGSDATDQGTQQLKAGLSNTAAVDAAMKDVPFDPNAAKVAAAAFTAAGQVATQAVKNLAPQPQQGPPRPYFPGYQQAPQYQQQPPPAPRQTAPQQPPPPRTGGGLNLPPISLGSGQPAPPPPGQAPKPPTGAPKPPLPPPKPTTSAKPPTPGTSSGAIAGIAVAGVTVVGLAIGGIIYGANQGKKKKAGSLLLGAGK